MSFRGRYFTWHQRFLCQHKDLEYQEHPFDVHPKLCQAFRITDKYAAIEELSESIGPKPDVFRHFSLKSWKHAQLHWFVSIACNLLYVTSMHFTHCAFVIAELLSRHDKSAKMHSGINNSPASLALERQPKHSLKQSDLHHWEPVKLPLRLSGPLSARRILRERWLGLPMSSSAGVRGVLGARPLLSHVRAVSGAWLAPSPDRLPIRALSCRLLQHGHAHVSVSQCADMLPIQHHPPV